jgi:NAD(P)-dependent dehydrogenase (short-subunit alcohol dehydrogenase family)
VSEAFGLSDTIAVISGGGSGIGNACALTIGKYGARVAVIDKNLAGAEATAATIEANGGRAIALSCDVSEHADIEAAGAAVENEFGLCDVLVNNAAVIRAGALENLSLADWNLLLSVNLTGYFLCAQIFARQMRKKGGGSIIQMASVAAHHPTPIAGAYSVAKAAVQMLSRQMAIEWGKDGIRSNCVNPGLILTPFSKSMYDRPGIKEHRAAMVPAGRIGTPEDVAEAVLFLAGDRSRYINGDEITVDGGLVRNLMGFIPRAGYGSDA